MRHSIIEAISGERSLARAILISSGGIAFRNTFPKVTIASL